MKFTILLVSLVLIMFTSGALIGASIVLRVFMNCHA